MPCATSQATTATPVQETTPATTDPNGINAVPVYTTWQLEPYMDQWSIYGGYITAMGCWSLTAGIGWLYRSLKNSI